MKAMTIHTVRTQDGGTRTMKMARTLAVRAMCTECMGWDSHPKDCTSKLCPLYPFRGRTQATAKGDGGGKK